MVYPDTSMWYYDPDLNPGNPQVKHLQNYYAIMWPPCSNNNNYYYSNYCCYYFICVVER